MKIFLRTVAVLLLLVGIAAIGYALVGIHTTSTASVPAPAATAPSLTFEVADTEAAREMGFGNRASIPDNHAMLFVFDTDDRYGFWMKDMLVPIDIVWLSDTGAVVLIDSAIEPQTYPHVFYPPVPVKYIIETRAGYAADHGWTAGTHIQLPAPYGT